MKFKILIAAAAALIASAPFALVAAQGAGDSNSTQMMQQNGQAPASPGASTQTQGQVKAKKHMTRAQARQQRIAKAKQARQQRIAKARQARAHRLAQAQQRRQARRNTAQQRHLARAPRRETTGAGVSGTTSKKPAKHGTTGSKATQPSNSQSQPSGAQKNEAK
jgi:hypothetical protein